MHKKGFRQHAGVKLYVKLKEMENFGCKGTTLEPPDLYGCVGKCKFKLKTAVSCDAKSLLKRSAQVLQIALKVLWESWQFPDSPVNTVADLYMQL